MKVIFLEDVRNVGRRHEVKEVSEGYARNFLFPNQLAEQATPGALKKLDSMKAERDQEDQALVKHLGEITRKINETKIQFTLKAAKDGSVFGSINKEAVLTALREHGIITKERVDVMLDHPIKELGEHKILIGLKKGITATLIVIAAKEE